MTGFGTARGRGYQPAQVERAVAELTRQRDEAWRRLGDVGLRVDELSREAARLSAVVADLPPPVFDSLGGRVRELLAEVEAEAAQVRATAEADAARIREESVAWGDALRVEARAEAARRRAAGDTAADTVIAEAETYAARLREDTRRWTTGVVGEAQALLEDTRRRCAALTAEQRRRQAVAGRALQAALAAQEAETEARVGELTGRADTTLERARRELAEAEAEAKAREDAAQARRAELLADARVRRQRVERDSEREARDLQERADLVRAHLAHIRTTLAALTGRTPGRRPPADREERE
jgi:hypothetical protein